MFAITGHKTQGKIYKDGIIVSLPKSKSSNYYIPNPSWFYVVLSRVPSLDKLYLTEKITINKKVNNKKYFQREFIRIL